MPGAIAPTCSHVCPSPGEGGNAMTGISMENLGPALFRTAAPVVQAVLRIGLVVVAGYVGARFLRVALDRLGSVLIKAGERTEVVPGATQQRVATLIGVLRAIALGGAGSGGGVGSPRPVRGEVPP